MLGGGEGGVCACEGRVLCGLLGLVEDGRERVGEGRELKGLREREARVRTGVYLM